MIKDVVLDTSFVIALLSERDPHHQTAVAKLSEVDNEAKVILPGIVQVEAAMMGKGQPDEIIRHVRKLIYLVDEVQSISKGYFERLMDFMNLTQVNLKPNDYSVLQTAIRHNALLLTFDGKLNKAYSEIYARLNK